MMLSIHPKFSFLRTPFHLTHVYQGSDRLRESDISEIETAETCSQSYWQPAFRGQVTSVILIILYLLNALVSWSEALDPSEDFVRFLRVVVFQQQGAATLYKSDHAALASLEGIELREKLSDQLWAPTDDKASRNLFKGFTKSAKAAAKRCRQQLDGGVDIHGTISTQDINYTWTLNAEVLEVQVGFSAMSFGRQNSNLGPWMDGPPTWVAVGFTQESGMRDADIVVLRESAGNVVLEDRSSVGYAVPKLDEQQDYHLLNYSWSDEEVSFAFRRSLLTGDVYDWNVVASPVQVIWALGWGKGFQHHDLRGSLWVDLFKGERLESRPKSIDSVTRLGDFMLSVPKDESSRTSVDACRNELETDLGAEALSLPIAREVALARCLGRQGDLSLAGSLLEKALASNSSIDAVSIYEDMLSDHSLARILLKICRRGEATTGFAFTRCRLTHGENLFGEMPGALLAVGVRLAQLIALVAGVARVSLHWQCGIFALALLYCDGISAGVHLIMDNYNMLRWPVIRPEALGFQSHHLHPTDSLNFPYHRDFSNLSAALMYGSLFLVLSVFPVRRKVADCSRCLMFYCIPLNMLLMHTHAYAHLHPHEVPAWVLWAQRWRLLLRPEDHLQHHVHFARDFGVLNGWSHPVFNWILRNVMHHQDENWAWVFLGILFLPAVTVVCFVILDLLLGQVTRSKHARLKHE